METSARERAARRRVAGRKDEWGQTTVEMAAVGAGAGAGSAVLGVVMGGLVTLIVVAVALYLVAARARTLA